MTIEELKELTNNTYISDVAPLLSQLNITSNEDKLAFLELVYTYNNDFIKDQEKRIRLAKQREKDSKKSLIIPQVNETLINSETPREEVETKPLGTKAQEILSLLEISDLDEVTSLLPDKNNPSFAWIMNQVMVTYYKDIVFLNSYLHSPQLELPLKEKEELQKGLVRKNQIFNILKNYRTTLNEDELTEKTEPPCLIHLETPKKESYLEKDIESLSPELYIHFLKIYEPFIKGEPVLSHHMGNNRYNKLVVVKNRVHQARIYTVHLTDNIQVLLGALNKKQDWGKMETNYVGNRYSSFTFQRDKLLEQIQDDSFIALNQERTERVLTLLKRGAK